jgi:NAD(P)-dependent dehydrogenase (short-subunit alcohol dehydrogenase family)
VVAEIRAAGGEAAASYDDVATLEGGRGICRTALDAFDRVDILVNNAGFLRDKSFLNTTEELWDPVVAVHLKGTYCVTHPVYCQMKDRGAGGVIVNTSSTSGLNGNFGQSNYGAAKMGLVGLSNVLAVEGAKSNVKCNVIAPIARTRLTEQLLGPMADKLSPDCVTPLAVYLVSESCQLTHEIFDVGGGRYARIFIGMNPGWVKGAGQPASVEEIAANLDKIRDTSNFVIPDSIAGEMQAVAKAFQGQG